MTTVPSRIVFTKPICDYCGEPDSMFVQALGELHGIKVCNREEHLKWAERDVKAWFHSQKMVLIEDILKVYDISKTGISVPRSDGSTTEGGELIMSSFSERSLTRKENGIWLTFVSFDSPTGKLTKGVDIMKIKNDSQLLENLEKGFYKDEYEKTLELISDIPKSSFDGLRSAFVEGTGIIKFLDYPPTRF